MTANLIEEYAPPTRTSPVACAQGAERHSTGDSADSQSLLKLLPALPGKTRPVQLPTVTSASDIRELIQHLKKKPSGVIVAEEADRVKKRIFDPGKLAAYALWGIICAEGASIKLSRLGWELADVMETEAGIFRRLLAGIPEHHSTLEWIYKNNVEVATATDVRSFWQASQPDAIGRSDADTMRGAIISFFHLCQAAELGTIILGKRGHVTRLWIDRAELSDFLEGKKITHLSEKAGPAGTSRAQTNYHASERVLPEAGAATQGRSFPHVTVVSGAKTAVEAAVLRTLEFAGVESSFVERDWSGQGTARVGKDVRHDVRGRGACIFILGSPAFTRADAGPSPLREEVLMEIGAALFLFERQVLLLWDEERDIPDGFHGLTCRKFKSGELSWETGLQILEAIGSLTRGEERPGR